MLDSAGKLRVHTKYDSFGNAVEDTHYSWTGSTVTSGPNYIDEAFAYTGRWFDKDTVSRTTSTAGTTRRSAAG